MPIDRQRAVTEFPAHLVIEKTVSDTVPPGLPAIRSSSRAADGNRTHDLFLTKEVLYQLSYSSIKFPTTDIVSVMKGIRPQRGFGQSGRRESNPQHLAWKASALPLSYSRSSNSECGIRNADWHFSRHCRNGVASADDSEIRIPNSTFPKRLGREGFEPPNSEEARFTVWCN